MILNEDNCGIKEPHPAAILGILRNIAFNLRLGTVSNPSLKESVP